MVDVIRSERRESAIVLTVANPPANAISRAVVAGLREAIEKAAADEGVRAVIITGEGEKFFAAGADVKEFGGVPKEALLDAQKLTRDIAELPVVVIAAINGIALGGGCELAMGCDVRFAAENAKFGQPEINLGIIPGWGGTQRLPRLIGRGRATHLLLTGETIDAATALSWGLVTKVVPAAHLLEVALEFAGVVAGKPKLAIAATKRCLARGLDAPLADGLDIEAGEFVASFETADAKEGITAFVEKRQPVWTHR